MSVAPLSAATRLFLLLVAFGLGVAPLSARAEDRPAFGEERITLSLTDATVSNVLRALAANLDLDLVLLAEDTRRISVSFEDRPVNEALEEILNGSRLAFLRRQSTLRILPADAETVELIQLNHAPAADLANTIREASGGATVVGDDNSNLLIVTGRAKALEQVAAMAREADHLPQQVLIRSRIFEVGLADETGLGIDWTALFSDGDLTVDGMSNLFPLEEAASTALRVSTEGTDGVIDAIARHISDLTESQLISSPEIVTSNREAAKILVGERVPYTRLTAETETGSLLQEVEFVDIGILMEVLPQVSRDGMVGLKIDVEISELLDREVDGSPRIGTREAHTRVSLRTGETLLIGGLMRTNTVEETSAIPLLGRIPGIGRLFRHEGTRVLKTELAILISPEVVGPAMLADGTRRKAAVDERLEDSHSSD